MSRTRLFQHALPLVALLTACSGGQQTTLPPDTATQSQDSGAQPQNVVSSPLDSQAATAAGTPLSTGESPDSITEATTIPAHIPVWAYDEYASTGAHATAAQIRAYVSFAQGGLGNTKAVADCAGSSTCKSVFYFNPHFFYDTSSCGSSTARKLKASAQESWYVHLLGYSTSSHRIHGTYNARCSSGTVTVPVYAMNTLNAGVRSYYASYLHTYAAGFDEFFLDDTSGKVSSQFYGPGGGFCAGRICTATQEIRNDAAVIAEHGALATSLTHPNGTAMLGVFNGVNFSDGRANDLNIIPSSPHFNGAVCEGCIVSAGKARPTMFASVLNAMAQANAIPNASFVLLSDGGLAGNIPALIAARTLTTGVIWLGYSNGHTIVWPNLEEYTENLPVYPEDSIYPSSPIQTMTTAGATSVQVASNVYRREFRSCYYNRSAIGPCAAIVNGTGGNVVVRSTWLHQTYTHRVELIGTNIPNRGTLSLTAVRFIPNSTYVAPASALLIVR